jgi:hypothetical protein
LNSYWEIIRIKLKYSGFVRLFLDALGRIGVRITPYYIFVEGLSDKLDLNFNKDFEEYDLGFLSPDDMKVIAAIPGRHINEKKLIERLDNGKLCFGLKLNGELCAFTWCSLTEFRGIGKNKALAKDEAYLSDAYTFFPFRGRGIAPYIRYELYKEIAKLGKHKLYSYSSAFNAPSLKFKKKLKARIIEKHIYIKIFDKWKSSFLLKKFNRNT